MNRLLADTHALIWYLEDSPRLSINALVTLKAVAAKGGFIFVSAISLIEIGLLVDQGRITPAAYAALIQALQSTATELVVYPVDLGVVLALPQIPQTIVPDLPRRIIAATARHLDVPLVTGDDRLQLCGLKTIW
jgi:PIN domain nuclease of toxin-antitoxin system